MSSRVLFISTAVFVGCVAFVFCHLQGFRVFDHSMWSIRSVESGVCSPPELLVFFGGVVLGFVAGIVVFAASAVWLVQRFRHIFHHSRRA